MANSADLTQRNPLSHPLGADLSNGQIFLDLDGAQRKCQPEWKLAPILVAFLGVIQIVQEGKLR